MNARMPGALAPLLEPSRRGQLLDVVVFGGNLLGVTVLDGFFPGVLRRASAGDQGALAILFGVVVLLFVLAPLGATLKRWHYHRRLEGRAVSDVPGCLFSPIFYFCLAAVIFATVNAFVMQRVYGGREPDGTVFVSSIMGGIVLIIVHTVLVYRYFSPPQRPPASAFMRGPVSEVLGDACLFANMLLFQMIWGLFSFAGIGPPDGLGEAVGRLGLLCVLALLLYFPPRMFYLAEDAGRAGTWVMILVANAPVIVHLLVGS